MSQALDKNLQDHIDNWINIKESYNSILKERDELKIKLKHFQTELDYVRESEKKILDQLNRSRNVLFENQKIISHLTSLPGKIKQYEKEIKELKGELEKSTISITIEKELWSNKIKDTEDNLEKRLAKSRCDQEITEAKLALQISELEDQLSKNQRDHTEEINSLIVSYENKLHNATQQCTLNQERIFRQNDEMKNLRTQLENLERELKYAERTKSILVEMNKNNTANETLATPNINVESTVQSKNVSKNVKKRRLLDENFYIIPNQEIDESSIGVFQEFNIKKKINLLREKELASIENSPNENRFFVGSNLQNNNSIGTIQNNLKQDKRNTQAKSQSASVSGTCSTVFEEAKNNENYILKNTATKAVKKRKLFSNLNEIYGVKDS